jgi:hypothetical protein
MGTPPLPLIALKSAIATTGRLEPPSHAANSRSLPTAAARRCVGSAWSCCAAWASTGPTPEHLVTDIRYQAAPRLAEDDILPTALSVGGAALHDPLKVVGCNAPVGIQGDRRHCLPLPFGFGLLGGPAKKLLMSLA